MLGAILMVACLVAPATAQDHDKKRILAVLHHDDSLPDYVGSFATVRQKSGAALGKVLVPAQAPAAAHLAVLHHDDARPNYMSRLNAGAEERPEHPPVSVPRPPEFVRGVYLNAWVFGSSRLDNLIALADTTEINAFVIDVKDASGYVTYPSSVPTAIEVGANGELRAPDTRERLNRLQAHGIHAIARIVVARDPILAKGKPQWAIHDARGGLWRDGLGKPWVDAYNDSVWVYAAELAREAVRIGFAEIQFDYVRFPDEPPHRLALAVYPARREGETQRSSLARHLALLRDHVKPMGVPFTIDVFGLTTSTEGGLGIGQYWEDLIQVADVVLPMVYPSHYRRGAYGLSHPNSQPYTVVRRAIEDGIRRAAPFPKAGKIRPYLQAFTLGRPRYSGAEVRAQIAATEDAGLKEWILWNPRGVYPADGVRRFPVTTGITVTAGGEEQPLR